MRHTVFLKLSTLQHIHMQDPMIGMHMRQRVDVGE